MIYLDNAATTRVFPEITAEMQTLYDRMFFNPSSTYLDGIKIKQEVEKARGVVAEALSCNPSEIYFTSCATESNNWALTSGFKNKKGNIVISAGEHACVYECAKNLKSRGADVRVAALNPDGTVNADSLLSLVDENTCLTSVIHVSNETGVINDIAKLSQAVKGKNKRTLFHSDGVQAFLKTENAVKKLGVDLYSISGHKIGAPKGVGALYISSDIFLQPLLYGGGQENGMRAGTENTISIIALAKAVKLYKEQFDHSSIEQKRNYLINKLKTIENVKILSENARNTGLITAFCALGTKAEIIQTMCADDGVIIGRGSACSSKHSGNRVLSEMGLTGREIDGALRLSIAPTTTEEEIDTAVQILAKNIHSLRGNNIG